jgi:pimeloyl-ACP methyl ester carboxylesterase
VPASEFPVPAELVKRWCDNQQDRDATFQQILAPFIKIPVRTELTEAYLDDFQKAARVALEETLSMCGASFADQAGRIRVPTLVLAGEFDPLISPDLVRGTVLTHIATARMVALPCGHEIPQELPEQTAALLEAFICGVGTSVASETVAV